MEQYRREFRVVKMCQVLGVTKSGYYDWRKRPKSDQRKRKEVLTKEIKRVYFQTGGIYGSPKIKKMLDKKGIHTTQKTVSRIMKENNIRSKVVRKYKATTYSNHQLPVFPNLLNQQFDVDKPGAVWVADITYIWTKEGWLYLASVMDLFSRRIIGWQMSHRMTKELVITALKRAIQKQPPTEGLIHHSDRGSQYASHDHRALLKKFGITGSMSRKGNCYDNACIESFHSIIKKELIFLNSYKTRKQAKLSIFAYIETFYNYKRIHSTIDYLSPLAFEKRYEQSLRAQDVTLNN